MSQGPGPTDVSEHDDHHRAVDPDVTEADRVGPHVRAWRVLGERRDVLAVISAGGAIGSTGRWGVGELLPHASSSFAWSTWAVNVSGALALGALMLDLWSATRYVRPFLGVGVLGGYTTFSTYMLDARSLIAAGRVGLALAYVAATFFAGLVATALGIVVGRLLIAAGRWFSGRRRRRDDQQRGTDRAEETDARPTRRSES